MNGWKLKQKAADYTAELAEGLFLGWENVRVMFVPEGGGSFDLCPADNGTMMIRIGHKYGNATWPKVLEYALHEFTEAAMARMGFRATQAPSMSSSSAGYLFFMTHEQFAEVTACVAHIMALVYTPLREHFDKVQDLKALEKELE